MNSQSKMHQFRMSSSKLSRAYAQMSFLRPDLLHNSYLEIATKLLRANRIARKELNLTDYPWQFGLVKNPAKSSITDPRTSNYYLNLYHTNLPIYVNDRLPSEFTGDKFVIGGGKKCTCIGRTGRSSHPEEGWYSIDMKLNLEPDIVMNAELAQHLHFLPSARFSMILVEHVDLAGFFQDNIVEQYLRILKPNGVIMVHSTKFADPKSLSAHYKTIYEKAKAMFESKKFHVTPMKQTRLSNGWHDTSWVATAPTILRADLFDTSIRTFKFVAENYVAPVK